jgi:tetratricopeptide (TPR) repeat protein
MKMVSIMYKLKKLDDNQVLDIYDQVKDVCDKRYEKAKEANKPKWIKTSEAIDAILETTVTINCDFVRTQWGEKLKNDPNDLKLAKKAVRFMLKDKCTDDPLFLIAAENVFRGEPSVGTGSVIIKKYMAMENYDKAEEYMAKVMELAKDDLVKQSELNEDYGDIRRLQGKLSDARGYYLKAAELNSSRSGELYSKIGNMYMSSFKSCLQDKGDPVKDRVVYLAAYDMFAKAGDSAGMSRAQQQFPTMSDIFTSGYEVGQSLPVGCWIGGSTTVRKRP